MDNLKLVPWSVDLESFYYNFKQNQPESVPWSVDLERFVIISNKCSLSGPMVGRFKEVLL